MNQNPPLHKAIFKIGDKLAPYYNEEEGVTMFRDELRPEGDRVVNTGWCYQVTNTAKITFGDPFKIEKTGGYNSGTFMMWFYYPSGSSGYINPINSNNEGVQPRLSLSSNKIEYRYATGGSITGDLETSKGATALVSDTWYFWILEISGNNLKSYLGGKDSSFTLDYEIDFDDSVLGNTIIQEYELFSNSSSTFYFFDYKVFEGLLSSIEKEKIRTFENNGQELTFDKSQLIRWHTFNESKGTISFNRVLNNFYSKSNGTIVNANLSDIDSNRFHFYTEDVPFDYLQFGYNEQLANLKYNYSDQQENGRPVGVNPLSNSEGDRAIITTTLSDDPFNFIKIEANLSHSSPNCAVLIDSQDVVTFTPYVRCFVKGFYKSTGTIFLRSGFGASGQLILYTANDWTYFEGYVTNQTNFTYSFLYAGGQDYTTIFELSELEIISSSDSALIPRDETIPNLQKDIEGNRLFFRGIPKNNVNLSRGGSVTLNGIDEYFTSSDLTGVTIIEFIGEGELEISGNDIVPVEGETECYYLKLSDGREFYFGEVKNDFTICYDNNGSGDNLTLNSSNLTEGNINTPRKTNNPINKAQISGFNIGSSGQIIPAKNTYQDVLGDTLLYKGNGFKNDGVTKIIPNPYGNPTLSSLGISKGDQRSFVEISDNIFENYGGKKTGKSIESIHFYEDLANADLESLNQEQELRAKRGLLT